MADFVVAFSNGKVITYSGEGSRYLIENGVLTVYDGKGKRLRYSPTGWLCVEDADRRADVPVIEVLTG